MDADTLLKTRRSARRYRQEPVPADTLREIVDVARYAPSGGNAQGWELVLCHESEKVAEVFETLGWLPAVGAPPEGKRPTAYLVVVTKGEPKVADCASLVTCILLAAHARGVGTCWFGFVRRGELAESLGIPDTHFIAFVVSLGYPDESFETHDSADDTAVTVADGIVRVPKKPLSAILHENAYGQ